MASLTQEPLNATPPKRTNARFYLLNAVASAVALGIVFWLLVVRDAQGGTTGSSLPALNATLNATAGVLLVAGRWAISKKNIRLHRALMIAAFAASSLFLASYLTYHFLHGDTPFGGQGHIRTVYFALLISHILLSIPILPMALAAFYWAFQRDFRRHTRLTRILFPMWLYVSVTGVTVYFMLQPYYPQ